MVGLTGGIGSGKSVVADLFAQLGVAVIDTDKIAHALTAAGGKAIGPVRREFGSEFIDASGALDRATMRRRVFADASTRQRLEAILHPMIYDESMRSLADIHADPGYHNRYCLLAVPLLFERMSFRPIIWRSLAVDCPVGLQIKRVQARSGLAAEEVMRVIRAQVPRAVRVQLADDVIANAGSIASLKDAVTCLHVRYEGAGECETNLRSA